MLLQSKWRISVSDAERKRGHRIIFQRNRRVLIILLLILRWTISTKKTNRKYTITIITWYYESQLCRNCAQQPMCFPYISYGPFIGCSVSRQQYARYNVINRVPSVDPTKAKTETSQSAAARVPVERRGGRNLNERIQSTQYDYYYC